MKETEIICRFCLKTIKKHLPIDKMTKEIIEILMLKLDLRITPEPVMCYVCAETLQTAFDFKSACIYTEDCLYPFIEGKSEAALDLREIYLKVNDNENVESFKGCEVCRFCMKLSDSDRCTPVDVIEENVEIKKLLENYLPEVVMGAIEKPVACENCLSFLHQYSLFVTSLSHIEQQIQSFAKTLARDYVGEIDLKQVRDFSLSNVTKREVETIGNDKVTKQEVMILSEIESIEKIIPEEKIECEKKEISESKINTASPETERREQEEFNSFTGSDELFTSNQILVIEKPQADIEMKRPFLELFGTEVKGEYLEEDAIHIEETKRDSEESQRSPSSHKIDECQELEASLGIKLVEFEIKKEDDEYDGNENDTLILIGPGMVYSEDAEMKPTVVDLSCNPEENHTAIENGPDQNTPEMEMRNPAGHQVKSVEDVEGRIYRCKHCPYKTKLRYYLPKHMLVHKDISEVTAQRCKLCPFKTKWKGSLLKHMLIHKDPSKIRTYDCNLCSYKTKRKRDLNRHLLSHKDHSESTYYCNLCSYKAVQKCNLKKHMLVHRKAYKDPSESSTYDCNLCSYKAVQKSKLKRHMLVHRKASDGKTCADRKNRRRAAIHQCPLCSYKTRGKENMTAHMRTHISYHCNVCPYKTNSKGHLTVHMFMHKDISKNASEIETEGPNGLQVKSDEDGKETVSQCKPCPQQTERKSEPIEHTRGHEDSFKNASGMETNFHVKLDEEGRETFFRCKLCPYKVKKKNRFTRHMLVHKDISEITTYDCSFCSYKAKLKRELTKHMLVHKDVSEVKTYACNFCPYKAKWRCDLTRHVMVHKDLSEVTTYDCRFCSYKGKRQHDLTRHMLVHKDFSEVTTYDCNVCSYRTKRKKDLNSHMLIHKPKPKSKPKVKSEGDVEETIYRCKLCPYKNKSKNCLTRHMLVHKDISEVKAYRCELCTHVTKRKHDLIIHIMRMHKESFKNSSGMETEDPNGLQDKSVGDSEETVYRCKLCPYKSKLRRRWTKHMLIHEDISEDSVELETNPQAESVEDVEGTLYRCKLCPYKNKLKNSLTRHMLVHKDISEVEAHQCKLCPYKTKRKYSLTLHMLVHKDISEVTTYDCNHCSFKTKHRQSLIQHMLIHMDDYKDAKSAQNQRESMSEHQELEGCSTIKSEEVDIKDEEDECSDASNKL